jgi:hypothetical protein
LKKLLCLCAGVLLIAGCAKKNDPIANIKEAAKDKDLQGTFTSDCQTKPLDASVAALIAAYSKVAPATPTSQNSANANGTSATSQGIPKTSKVSYSFTGARVKKTTTFYTDEKCQSQAGLYEEDGTIDIDKGHKTNDGGYNINMDFKNLKGNVTNPETANIANTLKVCGVTDWAGNQKLRDVTGHSKDLSCANTPLPRHVANIYRVDAGTLYLGTQTKSANLDKDRPASLDMGTKFHKQ